MTMKLQEKYNDLIRSANESGVRNLHVREQDNVLYIDGQAPTEGVKQKLWDIYGRLDPNYRAGDVVMNINVDPSGAYLDEYVVVKGDNLSNIGKKYNVEWKDIYEANRDVIRDPDLIQPGWKLKIPRRS